MKEFNAESVSVDTQVAMQVVQKHNDERHYPAYIGLDVHKETIAWAVARQGRAEPEFRGEIANRPKSIEKLVARLNKEFGAEVLLWCYEAGPCGYVLHRQLLELGQDCQVVAPSKIPKQPGERVKTDRRDAIKLAHLLRSGSLSAVWVPDSEQEAMRDLTRARGDMKEQERKAKQQLNAFLLRNGRPWPANKKRWSSIHFNWLEALKFDQPYQQVVLQEYINAVKAAIQRVTDMNQLMEQALPQWSMAPVVASLKALRGIDTLAAMILLAELGDISRFESPRQLMSFLGLVPCEHSSGPRRHQGGITKTGNTHARRVLVESSWTYRFPARQTPHLKRKAAGASEEAKAIGWKAQKRLCGRYRTMSQSGKNTKVVCVAIARELVGFIWDIACREMPKAAAAQ
jgi:transposase